MTANELSNKIGTTALLISREKFAVQVKILDARSNYGRHEYLVEPVAGAGSAWVTIDRLTWEGLKIQEVKP